MLACCMASCRLWLFFPHQNAAMNDEFSFAELNDPQEMAAPLLIIRQALLGRQTQVGALGLI